MKVQLNTDANIEGNEALSQQVEAIINNTLDRFSQHITRVEVHLSDENSSEKFGANDKRCLIEVRLANHQPIAASDQGQILQQSISGAAEKMKKLLDTTIGKLRAR
ncbi:HPF/RaiA family ribosome-associated protein [Microcoleus sp. herbarium5]|uniref:HPF/RaiA family ribosome-associated protein n=1 Tax=Microcoleus sp. herbarium5 TaxID=3055434 RepID=UPI002FD67752